MGRKRRVRGRGRGSPGPCRNRRSRWPRAALLEGRLNVPARCLERRHEAEQERRDQRGGQREASVAPPALPMLGVPEGAAPEEAEEPVRMNG